MSRSNADILIVDDQAEVARALVALARTLGYRARAVFAGEQALDAVRTGPPDLMLLDLQMPGLSGLDVLRALRADRRFDDVPVVVCSAAGSTQARDEALRSGAQGFLAKEDAFEELESTLDRQLAANDSSAPDARH